MTDIGGVRMYFGHSNYYARRALEKMEEPHGMLSAEAANAATWEGTDDLFVDSGGYQLMLDGGEHPPLEEYLETVRKWDGDRFAVQDFPCEPDILAKYGRSVSDHQWMTTERAAEALAAYDDGLIDAKPISVIQGWELDDYLRHIDKLREAGCLTDRIGIGSVCRRNQTKEIRQIVLAIRDALPSKHGLHAFGVKNTILADREVRDALASADTTAWYYRNFDQMNEVDETWQEMVTHYLEYRHRLAGLAGEFKSTDHEQSTLFAETDGGKPQSVDTGTNRPDTSMEGSE